MRKCVSLHYQIFYECKKKPSCRPKASELLEVVRKSLKEMKHWKQKRLDNYRNTMTTVGRNTNRRNSDLQHILKKMYKGVLKKKQVLQNPVCRWLDCGKQFESVETLYEHTKHHIEMINTDLIAPIH